MKNYVTEEQFKRRIEMTFQELSDRCDALTAKIEKAISEYRTEYALRKSRIASEQAERDVSDYFRQEQKRSFSRQAGHFHEDGVDGTIKCDRCDAGAIFDGHEYHCPDCQAEWYKWWRKYERNS